MASARFRRGHGREPALNGEPDDDILDGGVCLMSRETTPLVVYCGCCPWDKCPNIRPAFHELQTLGFANAKTLLLPHNFQSDWVAKGLPIERERDAGGCKRRSYACRSGDRMPGKILFEEELAEAMVLRA